MDQDPAVQDAPGGPLRWGIVGPGGIARKMAGDLALLDGHVLQAVGSRALARAQEFAASFDAHAAYGSYAEVLADPAVEVVYVATPHRQHHALALAAIEAGKHLLVEKSFTATSAGAAEVVEAARRAGVFCMEAMWTRFQPAMIDALGLVRSGGIGEVRAAHADLGFRAPFDPSARLWDRDQAGGALLDVGVYTIAFLEDVFGGPPEAVEVTGSLAPNGADSDAVVLWRADGGRAGVAQCSLISPLPGAAAVYGTEGWVEIPPRFHHPTQFLVHRVGADGRAGAPQRHTRTVTGTGFAHELEEVRRCIRGGETESAIMPLDDTLTVMQVLETALHALGVHYEEAAADL